MGSFENLYKQTFFFNITEMAANIEVLNEKQKRLARKRKKKKTRKTRNT